MRCSHGEVEAHCRSGLVTPNLVDTEGKEETEELGETD
jgi:hypothetical protein